MASALEVRTFKIIVIGDSYTGKTTLTCRLCTGRFFEKLDTTIGVDFFEKTFQVNDECVKLQLWDTAGQERFRKSMTSHYYRNVDAIVLVYDVTSPPSFESLSLWVEEYKHYTVPEKIMKVLIGNKSDLKKLKRVDTSDAKELADQLNMPFWEVSTKSDSDKETIEKIFANLAEKLYREKPLVCLKNSPPGGNTLPPRKRDGVNANMKDEKAKLEKEKKTCCKTK